VNGYQLQSPQSLAAVGLLLAGVALLGYLLTRLPPRRAVSLAAWVLTVTACVAAERLTADEPAGVRMIAIILATLLSLKGVVGVASQAGGDARLPARAWFPFALGWFGMRPAVFVAYPGKPRAGAAALAALGMRRLAAGAILIAVARAAWVLTAESWSETPRRWAITLLLLPGISLALHFGVLNVLAGWWRFRGADTRALFRAPAISTSLSEYWGRRWNLAFSEMAALAIFRPLRKRCGDGLATAAVFAFSGVVHELAISLPVRGGYGLPMLYFGLHGLGMQLERLLRARGHRLGGTLAGRIWTAAWILLPLPLLFHLPFLRGCVWPLIGA